MTPSYDQHSVLIAPTELSDLIKRTVKLHRKHNGVMTQSHELNLFAQAAGFPEWGLMHKRLVQVSDSRRSFSGPDLWPAYMALAHNVYLYASRRLADKATTFFVRSHVRLFMDSSYEPLISEELLNPEWYYEPIDPEARLNPRRFLGLVDMPSIVRKAFGDLYPSNHLNDAITQLENKFGWRQMEINVDDYSGAFDNT